MKIALISTYELGRQPFGLASAAAWLKAAGHAVQCVDTAVQALSPDVVRESEMIAFHLPMHTAARLAVPLIAKIRQLNPAARLCCFGLYAPLNESYLRSLGVDVILGAEFEGELVRVAAGETATGSLERLQFVTPDRSTLPPLGRYAHLQVLGQSKIVAGYTEASRGCKHRCRHCPIVPVYNGQFRVVQHDVVMEDIRRQVSAGARHITFGDPDFFNGPTHAARLMRAFHAEFPTLTYDVTIKVEHLLQRRDLLPVLKQTGCLFVTSAVESIDDAVLAKLEKGHTKADFLRVVEDFREQGLTLAPTFIAFTPWTTRESYQELLRTIAELDLVANVSPVQLGLRLLIPSGSRLLELDDIQKVITGYSPEALLHHWRHADPEVDKMPAQALKMAASKGTRSEIFARFWHLAYGESYTAPLDLVARAAIPYMDEPWYC